ncbi:MAG: flippase-like domain-containing protein [Gemmatimonadaceae bacterium]|nr:flippase-like domain-containing protein [Gemmatimonadaceae bacterium]
MTSREWMPRPTARRAPGKESGAPINRRRTPRWVPPLAVVSGFVLAAAVLHREMRTVRYADVAAAAAALPGARVVYALLLTALAYLALTRYDALALSYAKRRVSERRVMFGAFVAYAMSQTLGFALVTGGALRFRFWSAWGLSTGEIARAIAFSGTTFTIGLLFVTGTAFVLHPADGVLPPPLTVTVVRALGLVSLAVVSSYVFANVSRETPVRLLGWELPMPGWRLALMQLAVAIVEWTLATMVLYVLLPAGHGMGVLAFSALFLLAQVAGLLSHVPGGVGVFDTLMVLLMKPAVPVEQMMATLLLYRLVYYLLPMVVGAVLLAVYEARARVVGAADESSRGIALL